MACSGTSPRYILEVRSTIPAPHGEWEWTIWGFEADGEWFEMEGGSAWTEEEATAAGKKAFAAYEDGRPPPN